jgi:transcriptional regulator with XRE-family HTH domain
MFKLNIGDAGLKALARLEKGFDIAGGYTELSNEIAKETFKDAFCTFMKKLRLSEGVEIVKLSKKIDVNVEILEKLEHDVGFKPDPRTLLKLSQFYKIPMKAFVELVGAKINIEHELRNDLVGFALKSESLEQLTKEEKRLLKEFVGILKKRYE